jgi:hypothetical protein
MSLNYKKTYWKKILLLDWFLLKILKYNRLKIQKIFRKKIRFKNLLDVGTTPVFDENNNIILHSFKNLGGITSLSNLDCAGLKKHFKKVRFVQGDARRMKFKDNKFDVVYSNATIEHVGSKSNQINFIKECLRVSRRDVFITTPNKFYPIEFHTKLPLIHFFPPKIYRKILFFFGFSFFSKKKNLNLLSAQDLINICFFLKIKNYNIIRYKFLYITSNLLLHIKK